MPKETLKDLRARNAALKKTVKELCDLTEDHFYRPFRRGEIGSCIECGLNFMACRKGHKKGCKYEEVYKKAKALIGGP